MQKHREGKMQQTKKKRDDLHQLAFSIQDEHWAKKLC